MGKRKTTAEIIELGKKLYGNRFTYEHTIYIDCKTPITITCPIHGDMQKMPAAFVMGRSGCRKCNGDVNRKTTDAFVKKAHDIHGGKYDYSLVDYTSTDSYVTIICHRKDEFGVEHGNFRVTPHAHIGVMRSGCPKCSNKYKYNTEEWIRKARRIHGNKYDYSKVVYKSCHSKICIICHKVGKDGNEHGEFWVEPNSHTGHMKSGCIKCMGEALGDLNRIWNYETCYNEALKYTCSSAFAKGNASACGIAQKNNWIKDYYWFKTPIKYSGDPKAKIHVVYLYEFPQQIVYIGRTSSPKDRDRHHRKPYLHRNGKLDASTVYRYAQNNNCDIPPMIILENNLTLEESRVQEDSWLNIYKNKGYTALNIGKTGRNSSSIGAFTRIWTIDKIKEKACQFSTIKEFNKAHAGAVAAMRKYKLTDELFPNKKSPKAIIQYDHNGAMIRKYKSASYAAKVNNCTASCILNACDSKKLYRGYKWEYNSQDKNNN